jgi:KDO2-lipid IV(A) lauroyltransferase
MRLIPKPTRKRIEVWLARLGLVVIPRLPRRALVGMARVLGGLASLVPGRARTVGLANLDVAFGDSIDARGKRAILRQSFRTFTLLLLDTFWFTRDSKQRIARWVVFAPDAERIFVKHRQVCVTGHFGNWEIIGQAVALRGYPLMSVATPLANPAIDDLFNRMRKTTGQVVVPKRGAIRRLLGFLKDGGKVALLLDQNTRQSDGGVFMDFFGLPALVSPAGASLARRTRSEILLGFCLPRPDGTYLAEFPRTIDSSALPGEDMKVSVARLNREILAAIEERIRLHPGMWLWMYKRWKHREPGTSRDRYPAYTGELAGGRPSGPPDDEE